MTTLDVTSPATLINGYGDLVKPRGAERPQGVTAEELTSRIDMGTMFLMAYVPYVVAEIAWDYADTCINLAILQRIKATKPLCRRVRELRKDYDRIRAKHIDDAHRATEVDNMIAFQEDYHDYFAKLRWHIGNLVKAQHPDLCTDSMAMISSAYTCAVVLGALFKYVGEMQSRVEVKLGRHIRDIMVFDQHKELARIILQFCGEDSIDGKNALPDELQVHAEVLANYLLQSEMVVHPSDPVEEK